VRIAAAAGGGGAGMRGRRAQEIGNTEAPAAPILEKGKRGKEQCRRP